MMSSKPVPQSSAPAMASSNADLARPLGTEADTNLRRASAKKQVSKMKAVETAIHGTRAIFTICTSQTNT